MSWWYLIPAFVAGVAFGAISTIMISRRLWQSARRLTMRARGSQQLAELGHLAGGLAHEIKNPLSTININLKLLIEDLQEDRPEDESHRRWLRRLENVRTESDRVHGILDDFLRYARHYELQLQAVDLRRLVEELTDFFTPQAEAAGVVMRTSLHDSPVMCNVDSNMLKQALLNLMINAVQAMDEGGELIIRVSTQQDSALLEVINTGGKSIDPEVLPKIFNVYYSTKSGGSGLGLATTRRIVREHCGTISVDSEAGKGTRFSILLDLIKQ